MGEYKQSEANTWDSLDIEKNNNLWDEFLNAWPIERVRAMTLSNYTDTKRDDAFIYWLEFRLLSLGSIRGGSAFKFGIFARGDSKDKEAGRGLMYTDEHGWLSRHGSTPEEAFEKVKANILTVISAAQRGALDEIDPVDLSDMFKWKLAFLYQDRDAPSIVPIFNAVALKKLTKRSGKIPLSQAHRRLLEDKAGDVGIFEHGRRLWNEYAEMTGGEDYRWVELFHEMAQYMVASYKSRPEEFLKLIKEVWPIIDKEIATAEKKNNRPVVAISPFGLFYFLIFKKYTQNKLNIFKSLKKQWGLESDLPEEFPGLACSVSASNVSKEFFFYYIEDHTLQTHWQLFEEGVKGIVSNDTFDKAMDLPGWGIFIVSSKLYWVNPERNIPCGRANRMPYEPLMASSEVKDWKSYQDALTQIKENHPDMSYPEIAYNAYEANDVTQAKDEYAWVNLYKEAANYVNEHFNGKSLGLIEVLEVIDPRTKGLGSQKDTSKYGELKNLSPFSIFYYLNITKHTKHRSQKAKTLKELWSLHGHRGRSSTLDI